MMMLLMKRLKILLLALNKNTGRIKNDRHVSVKAKCARKSSRVNAADS
jgi:hypothetical protein